MKDFLVRFFVLVFVASFLLQVAAQISLAAAFNYASLRLNRSAPNSALSGFVCATPSAAGAGTEDSVTVTFPGSFSISGTTGNWTVSTAGIPAGSTAWPGIGTASSVSGKAVTFPSNDLNNGSARYCFAYTGASSTTGSTTGSQEGSIITRNSSNTIIDQSMVAVYVGNDQVALNATVPASASDFSAEIEQLTPASQNVSQFETITYEITYGSTLSYESDFTIQASWSLGTISGSSTPSVDIVEYVIGSAIDAYGGAPPVIDTVNRTISWDVEGFPANTTQTVRFQLRTTDAYTGPENVTFTTSGKIVGPGTETVPSTVTNTYKYLGPATPTLTPTPGPGGGGSSNSITPSVTPTPTATPPQLVQILDVEVTQINATYADVSVFLSDPSPVQILYGTSPNRLAQRVNSTQNSLNHTIRLSDLDPDTIYYFRVVIPGETPTREVFTFKTARTEAAALIERDTITIVSQNVILFDQFAELVNGKSVVVIPTGNTFQVKFGFKDDQKIKNIQLFIRPKTNVLGISTYLFPPAQAAGENTTMIRIKGSEYVGKLSVPSTPGEYELVARISDEDGHLLNEDVVIVKAVLPMKITNDKGRPIERATVMLEYFDSRQKRFVVVSSQALPIQNPVYSDYQGIVPLTLPQAQYRAKISAFGYKDKTVTWTIGPRTGQEYPQVKLEKTNITPLAFVTYLDESVEELSKSMLGPLYIFLHSPVFFTVVASITGLIFVLLIVLFVLSRSFHKLGIISKLFIWIPIFRIHAEQNITGRVISDAKPVKQASVMLFDTDDKLVKTLSTDARGQFMFQAADIKRIQVVKQEFLEATHSLEGNSKQLTINLESDETSVSHISRSVFKSLSSILELIILLILIALFISELLMATVFPFLQTLPFLILSIINTWMWRRWTD